MVHDLNLAQAIADAYYVLSDPERRKEYDTLRSTRGAYERTADPNASANFFTSFASMFTGSGAQAGAARPDADGVFGDVFEEVCYLSLTNFPSASNLSY